MLSTPNMNIGGHMYLRVSDGLDADVRGGGGHRMCFQIITSTLFSAMGRFSRLHQGRCMSFTEFLGAQAFVATSAACSAGVSSLPGGLPECTRGRPQLSKNAALMGHHPQVRRSLNCCSHPAQDNRLPGKAGHAPTWSSCLRLLESRALTMV